MRIEEHWEAILKQSNKKHEHPQFMAYSLFIDELSEIYNMSRQNIAFQTSTKGGDVGFNENCDPFIIIDPNGKNDVQIQSVLVHELTHLAQVYARQGCLRIQMRADEKEKKQIEMMTPDDSFPEDKFKELFVVLNKEKGVNRDYVISRLQYAIGFKHEEPSVFMELFYYLRALDKMNDLYMKIGQAAHWFYMQRIKMKSYYLK